MQMMMILLKIVWNCEGSEYIPCLIVSVSILDKNSVHVSVMNNLHTEVIHCDTEIICIVVHLWLLNVTIVLIPE